MLATSAAVITRSSPPSWRRGLKLPGILDVQPRAESPPSWRRGLKHIAGTVYVKQYRVASLVEAWIETARATRRWMTMTSPPSWRRGLKLKTQAKDRGYIEVASLVEAWIETGTVSTCATKESCRLPRGGVD